MRIICVTGTPGVGKTQFAKELSLLTGYTYFDLNSFLKESGISEGYDKMRRTHIVDEVQMAEKVRLHLNSLGGNWILDSHLSHFLPKKYVKICFVLHCDLKILKKRLQKRGYGPEKVRENLDAEIFNVCGLEAVEMGHAVSVLDSTPTTPAELAKIAKRILSEDGIL